MRNTPHSDDRVCSFCLPVIHTHTLKHLVWLMHKEGEGYERGLSVFPKLNGCQVLAPVLVQHKYSTLVAQEQQLATT